MFGTSKIRTTMDLAFSMLCVSPLTVLFWRGTFNIVTDLAITDVPFSDRWLPALLLYLIGACMKIMVDLTKHALRDALLNKDSWLQNLVSFILLYLDSSFGVVMWVGGFNLLAWSLGTTWYTLTCIFFIATGLLIAIKAFHCSGGIPLAIGLDTFENTFNPPSYFHTKHGNSSYLNIILDTFFTYNMVHTLVICCWWSMWELENRFILFPCEITVKDIQAWDSVIISYFLVFVVVAINDSVVNMEEKEGNLSKAAATNFTAFLTFLGSLNFWRGIWSLMDFYFFPSLSLHNNLLMSHVVGFLGTYLAGVSLTLTQRSERDSSTPQFQKFEYWSKYGVGDKRSQYEDLDQQTGASRQILEV